MECDICSNFVRNNGMNCPACARAALYANRLRLVETLVAKDRLVRNISNVLTLAEGKQAPNIPSSQLVQTKESAKQERHVRCFSDIKATKRRIDELVQRSEGLRKQIAAYRQEVKDRVASTATRRQSLHTVRSDVSTWTKMNLEPAEKAVRRGYRKYDALFAQIISDRVYLCKEAATLAGLKQYKHRGSDGSFVDTYWIGGLQIPDLREINSASPHQLTASLTHICRLVKLACNYLHIRLPSEITLPHENYPLPTMFVPTSSYQNYQTPFPSLTPSSSPTTSRVIDRQGSLPRPRILYSHKKLPQLAREDPARYILLVEGISLLAWDIVWLCRTQGLPVASSNWEEACKIGKNLWTLLVQTPRKPRPPLNRRGTSSGKDATVQRQGAEKLPITNELEPFSSLGVLSHGTSHKFLGTASALALHNVDLSNRTWDFATPISVTDKLRVFLALDMSGLEWEVLDEGEFRDMEQATKNKDDEAVIVNSKKQISDVRRRREASYDTDGNGTSDAAGRAIIAGRSRGDKGWMKLKNRPPPT